MKPFTILGLLLLVVFKCMAQVTSFQIDKSKLDTALMKTLAEVYQADQSPRLALIALERLNADGKTTDSLIRVIRLNDSLNLIKVEEITGKYGWPGPQTVGINGSQAMFLVIQHAGLNVQERYLPLIRQAEKEGKVLSSNLAVLEDRVAVAKGEKQLYGSQGFTDEQTGKRYIYPVEDPGNLDKRRAAMGLPPMEVYLRMSGFEWKRQE